MLAQIWCAPGSSTYVIIRWTGPIAAGAVTHLLDWASTSVANHMHIAGDGLVQSGTFRIVIDGVELWMRNANNHQQTWGVVSAAIAALVGFQTRGPLGPRAIDFQVYDGVHQVAIGYMRGPGGG